MWNNDDSKGGCAIIDIYLSSVQHILCHGLVTLNNYFHPGVKTWIICIISESDLMKEQNYVCLYYGVYLSNKISSENGKMYMDCMFFFKIKLISRCCYSLMRCL